ncbi:hydroxyisourate hydrolase [Paenibacillus sp. NPDC056579]|uniref:hydroxyisourate hydrolase n=1 Tax=Paenibacillus sp. NPDC056579 TaxID=3345871 RepID=UPI00369A6E41
MEGKISTHVLDLSCGRPAAGIEVALYRIGEAEARTLLGCSVTNSDGRTGRPLLEGADLKAGEYELVFFVADYFQGTAGESGARMAGGGVPFLNRVPIRFCVGDEGGSYHVPLLVSPGGYSTYRGS